MNLSRISITERYFYLFVIVDGNILRQNCHHQKAIVHWHDPISLVSLYLIEFFSLMFHSIVDRFHWQSNHRQRIEFSIHYRSTTLTLPIERIFNKSRLPPPSLFIYTIEPDGLTP